MADIKTILTQNMVVTATEFGIAVVQEMAIEALRQKPAMSLRDFTIILNKQVVSMKKLIDVPPKSPS